MLLHAGVLSHKNLNNYLFSLCQKISVSFHILHRKTFQCSQLTKNQHPGRYKQQRTYMFAVIFAFTEDLMPHFQPLSALNIKQFLTTASMSKTWLGELQILSTNKFSALLFLLTFSDIAILQQMAEDSNQEILYKSTKISGQNLQLLRKKNHPEPYVPVSCILL